MENHKLKKLTGWLLYNVETQAPQERPGALNVASDFERSVVPPPQGWRARLRHYHLHVLVTAGMLVMLGAWWAVGPYLTQAQYGDARLSLGGSTEALASQLTAEFNTYKLPVQYPDGSIKQYSYEEVGLTIDTTATIADLRSAQHGFTQRFMWWKPLAKPLSLSTQPKKLHTFIASHITASVQPSQDATISIEDGEITVKDAVSGKQYGLDDPALTLHNHAARLDSKPLKVSLLTLNPAVTAEELASSKQQLEKIINQPISFTIDQKVVKPTKQDIAAWLELTPDVQAKRVDVDINSGKVLEYINRIAKANVRSPRDQVVVTNDDGSKTVLVAGVNGLDISDKQSIATTVTNNVLDGKGVQASLPVTFKSYDTVSTSAYPKWIEVDITNKRMYAYERTSLIKTFLVSAGAPKTPTVTGKFSIYSKYTQKDMRGLNADGSKYFQPHVPWVNFFYKDYAIHGNYWRPTSYFGNINSSHGCVSTVPNEAAWIYDWAPIGTPVIVHD